MRGKAGDDTEETLPPRLRPQPRAAGGSAGEDWSQGWSDRPSPAGQQRQLAAAAWVGENVGADGIEGKNTEQRQG